MADITVMNKQEQEISTGATQENTATQPLPVEPVTPVPSYVEGLTEDEADQEAVTTEEPKFLSLEEILGMDTADLTAEKQGFFHSEKLGDIPYTAISYDDYKQAKKDCVTYDQDENGVIQTWPTGTAPCKAACPAHIAVQGYIKMAGDGRYQDALKLIKKDNPFPAICGSICRKYCEDACTRGTVDEALSIDEIKKFIAEQDMKAEHRYIPPMNSCTREPFTQKVAIIGAGPAGMSCAYFLAIEGYKPVVFEKEAAPGGMLVNGIPAFRVDKAVVNSEIEVLREMGVEFRCGVEVGRDVTIQQLRNEGYKAFYVAVGLQKATALGIEGEQLKGVTGGLDFLRRVNAGEAVQLKGDTIVIGGGNIFRGLSGANKGFDRVKGDQMGMLATVINSLALSSALVAAGVKARVLTAVRMEPIGEFYNKWKAIECMEAGEVVIMSAGTGNPFFTTDTGSSLRGIEIEADVMLKGTRVDGIYTADPEKDPTATKFHDITYDEVLKRGLKVMDLTATCMCKENNLPIIVFDMDTVGNLKKVMQGEEIGTLVHN